MSKAKIGENCNIGGHVFIESGAKVGNHVTVKNGISIWDLVDIEDDVFLGPHMIFTNDFMPRSFLKKKREDFLPTFVKKGATIGAGAVIVCGITIGQYAFVGAGSVVTKNIPPYGLVVGNP
ncbi:MAG: N-acetyltransferase [Deltaproteobacteria bacterium]|nr:N-acetyltransferase [Deltaproteobacteria bacterium]